jgi:hypothetical protein
VTTDIELAAMGGPTGIDSILGYLIDEVVTDIETTRRLAGGDSLTTGVRRWPSH